MGRKQGHEEDEIPTPSLTVNKLLKFALEKFTDRSRINNHVRGLLSGRGPEFVTLSAEVTTLKGNLKLVEKTSKRQKSNRSGGGGTPNAVRSAGTNNKHESKK